MIQPSLKELRHHTPHLPTRPTRPTPRWLPLPLQPARFPHLLPRPTVIRLLQSPSSMTHKFHRPCNITRCHTPTPGHPPILKVITAIVCHKAQPEPIRRCQLSDLGPELRVVVQIPWIHPREAVQNGVLPELTNCVGNASV
jgi:hypothetical protein